MSEIDIKFFEVFKKYKKVSYNSWTKLLSEDDRNAYIETNNILTLIAKKVLGENQDFKFLTTSNFFPKGGIRNNRPKDLWCSIINNDSETFVNMPQVYMIVSWRGIELGFSASIHPSDFSDQSIKKKLKEVIPSLFKLIPKPSSKIIKNLSDEIKKEKKWCFKIKTRLEPNRSDFQSLEKFILFLKSPKGLKQGSGSVSKFFLPNELGDKNISLENEFRLAFNMFKPLMQSFRKNYNLANELIDIDNDLIEYQKENSKPIIYVKDFQPSIKKITTTNNFKLDNHKTFKINKPTLKETSFIGRRGEDIVFEHEKEYLKDTNYSEKIIKHYEIVNDKPGWDITSYDLNGKKIFIEVKSTKQKTLSKIILTKNELDALKDKKEDYYIYLVTNVFNETEVNIEKIKNPFSLIDSKVVTCEPNTYTVDLRLE